MKSFLNDFVLELFRNATNVAPSSDELTKKYTMWKDNYLQKQQDFVGWKKTYFTEHEQPRQLFEEAWKKYELDDQMLKDIYTKATLSKKKAALQKWLQHTTLLGEFISSSPSTVYTIYKDDDDKSFYTNINRDSWNPSN